jgi:hypothetical protein
METCIQRANLRGLLIILTGADFNVLERGTFCKLFNCFLIYGSEYRRTINITRFMLDHSE